MLKITTKDGREYITDQVVHLVMLDGRLVGIASTAANAKAMMDEHYRLDGTYMLVSAEVPIDHMREIAMPFSPLMSMRPSELLTLRPYLHEQALELRSRAHAAPMDEAAYELADALAHMYALLYGDKI